MELNTYIASRINKNAEREISMSERISELENNIASLTESIEKLGYSVEHRNGFYEIIKTEMPTGDYTNPIQIPEDGTTIETGKWYYVDDKELPHEAKANAFVTVEDFNDKTWFDFV